MFNLFLLAKFILLLTHFLLHYVKVNANFQVKINLQWFLEISLFCAEQTIEQARYRVSEKVRWEERLPYDMYTYVYNICGSNFDMAAIQSLYDVITLLGSFYITNW